MPAPTSQLVAFLENRFKDDIKSHSIVPASEGMLNDFPENLDFRLRSVLKNQNISSLYSHQNEAFSCISSGEDTVLVSQTASGKTFSFLLPILNEYLQSDPPFTVMLLYPTKALSRDQEGTLGSLLKAASDNLKFGTFDGDTPRDERTRIKRSADFIISNPDMLHSGILPNHNRHWKNFLSRLKFIVIDEVHTYRGAFGSHVSNVFRRLLRVCALHGSKPIFVCSSATIGNPREHVESLFHRQFTVVDKDGAPRPQRDLYMLNPPLVASHGIAKYRNGPASIAIPLMRMAAKLNIRTICFCRARQQVERLYRSVVNENFALKDKIKPYRGGLLPNERRQLERELFNGKINTIITTNALELGIDIGDLDLCILTGHPGTIASFWQQAGRVGRKGKKAIIVFIAKDTPIDQYFVNHPEFITSQPVEKAWLNADNPYILLQHLPCAAHEYPLRRSEPLFPDQTYTAAIDVLKKDGTVTPYKDCLRYALQDYPARGVNLRGMTDFNIEIHHGPTVIGELDPIGARGTLYKDAIYQHLGTRFMSLDLDLAKKLCKVDKVGVDYYTEAVWEGRVIMTESDESKTLNDSKLDFGLINVNKQPKLYKKIREKSYENIGYGPITLPPFIYDTTGFSLLPPKPWIDALKEVDKRFINSALYGLAYVLHHSAPSQCMGDYKDIDTDVSLIDENEEDWQSALFVFDTHEGGVGYAEKIYENIGPALRFCRNIIHDCSCQSGCPACVTPLPPGVDNDNLESFLIESDAAIRCTQCLLVALLDGEIKIPEITINKFSQPTAIDPPPEDEEAIKLNLRLNRASQIMKQKRERLH